jgi:hypothetical protein
MPDITKCEGINCPIKEKCYRFTSKASEFRQSYFSDHNVGKIKDNVFICDYFWGEKSESTFNYLKDITNGTNNTN